MADQQKAEKNTSGKETTKKKVKADVAKAAEPAESEPVSRPAAAATVAQPKTSMKKSKLLPKNKHRLPRRQKKAQHKAAAHL